MIRLTYKTHNLDRENVEYSSLEILKNSFSSFKTISSKVYVLAIIFFSFFITQNAYAQPASPAGFVANPSTTGSGNVFLACGPNDVGTGNIVYKLFYAETALAPADPLTATEYIYGSTAGDGSGTAAFGFTLSGLTPGTNYSFWLYQYNTVTLEYSGTPTPQTQTANVASAQPAPPVGLVVNTSSGPGEIFLACGPNQVGTGNVVYKLFYSETATAPGNPLTATEYTFGSTGGDGGGTSAFGFTLAGLTPGTDYTFWLYQYNTSNMLYSLTAASGSAISGSATGPPTQPAGFVANFISDPASSGEVFLACGPNNVGTNNIVYKLFYSETASAPSDPTTATEYTFGSTGGDGSGTNAFGFRISSLAPAVSYTFWLYQYNTSTSVYSLTANSKTQISSGVSLLPVLWQSPLKAIVANNSVVLTWSVAVQINNEKFVVHHSTDGKHFSPIGEIQGAGTTNNLETYVFTQENPTPGYNYYRIQQVDFNGENDYSNIASLRFGKTIETSIYPNPAISNLIIDIEEESSIQITNLQGKVVQKLIVNKGKNAIAISELIPGIYFILFENGNTESFVKN